ncbi:hypothetical protein U9246_25920, partial [Escherichia coli]|nr:hypothetical protein [Escherichia coli]
QSSASSLSSGEYLPGSLQGKISSDGCLKKEQMVVSAIASTPHRFAGLRPVSIVTHMIFLCVAFHAAFAA